MFKNYCVVVMGNTVGAKEEIIRVSEIDPHILDARGILIGTFSSIIEVNELKEWFTSRNRSFLLFELNETTSAYNIEKKEIEEGLFGFLKNIDVNKMSEEFLKSVVITSETKTTKTEAKNDNKLNHSDIQKMTQEEKNDLLNELIDIGLENLSEDDKTLLHLLVK
jgi:hypothetical protein